MGTASRPFPLNSRIQALVAHPTEAHTVLAGGDTGLFVSHDGGAQWERIGAQGDVPTIWSLAIDPSIRVFSLPARALRGLSLAGWWTAVGEISRGHRPGVLHRRTLRDQRHGGPGRSSHCLGRVEIDGVFRSLDGGDTWTHVETGLYDPDIHAMTIAATQPTRVCQHSA